jgi:hypothetical protein
MSHYEADDVELFTCLWKICISIVKALMKMSRKTSTVILWVFFKEIGVGENIMDTGHIGQVS